MKNKKQITEAEEIRRGDLIADVLNLKPIKAGAAVRMFNTSNGTKTPLGLFRTMKRIINEGE